MATQITQLNVFSNPGRVQTFSAKIPGGRNTKNTDAYELGVNVAMSWRMGSQGAPWNIWRR